LSLSKEIRIDVRMHEHASASAVQQMYDRLRPVGRRLLRLPGLKVFQPAARRLSSVTEPAGRLYIRNLPTKHVEPNCCGLTVLSANLCHDWPRYRLSSERLERFARLVEEQDVDLVLLQEVSRTRAMKADEWLSERLGMAYVYSPANGHEHGVGFEEGVAIFSRFPLRAPRLRRLGRRDNPFVHRLGIGATVHSPCGEFLAFSVHLGLLQRQNAAQLSDLRRWVAGQGDRQPVLIGGDFNAHETSPQIRQAQAVWLDTYRHVNPWDEAVTHELRTPWGGVLRRARLDYIFMQPGPSNWRVVTARHLDSNIESYSDHLPVLARLVPVVS
jgi:endonuclease/exonuclease/phosphatase family metal-dependent hydrolase